MTAATALVRAAHLSSLMAVFGASAYLHLIRNLAAPRVPLAALSIAALSTAVLSFLLVAAAMTDDWHAAFAISLLKMVATQSFFGRVFLLRLFLLAVLAASAAANSRPLLMCTVAGLALASLGLTSHAAANGGNHWLAFAANDAVHLLCAGFWIGGLVVIAPMVRRREPDLVAALRIFSAWATWAVALIVTAGTVNALAILQPNMARPSFDYLAVLGIKIALAVIMAALALANRFRIAPAIGAGSDAGRVELAWTVAGELVLGLVVIVLAAFLGMMPPSASH